MDLELSDDQELFRETTARFIDARCPLPEVRRLADQAVAHDPAVTRDAGELGWFALFVPEELGGGSVSGSPLRDAVIVAEERGRFVQPGPFVATNVVACALAERRHSRAAGALPARARLRRAHRIVGDQRPRRDPGGGPGARVLARRRVRARGHCGACVRGRRGRRVPRDRRRRGGRGRDAVRRARRCGRGRGRPARRARPHPPVRRRALRRCRGRRRCSGRHRRRRAARRRTPARCRHHPEPRRIRRRDAPAGRDHRRLRQGPHRVRSAHRILPGVEAHPGRRQPLDRAEHRGAGRGHRGGGRPAARPHRRSSASPRPTPAMPA